MIARFPIASTERRVFAAVACALLVIATPASRAEPGAAWLDLIPTSGGRIDPDGTVLLLSEDGPVPTVLGACRFRFVGSEATTPASTVRIGRGVDSEGGGRSFRVVRAVRHLAPHTTQRLEARCGDAPSFTPLPTDAARAARPGTFVVEDRAAFPPVIETIELVDASSGPRRLEVRLAAAGPPMLLIEALGARTRIAEIVATDAPRFVRVDETVRRVRVTPISRGFRRGVPRIVRLPRAPHAVGPSFYVDVHDTGAEPP